jgi:hypothetical protein
MGTPGISETLRLIVAGRYLEPRNPFFGHFPTHYRPSPGGKATIRCGTDQPSRIGDPGHPTKRIPDSLVTVATVTTV